jgi:polyisoprenoid-binding protein YceI
MDSLRCLDLEDQVMNAKLIAHLRSEDFFAVDRFPEVTLRVRESELLAGATPGLPNLRVAAELTLRGETRPVEFFVTAAARADGALVAQGSLQLDRTLWGAIYGSGKFFARLGMHVVNDLVDLQVKVVAAP